MNPQGKEGKDGRETTVLGGIRAADTKRHLLNGKHVGFTDVVAPKGSLALHSPSESGWFYIYIQIRERTTQASRARRGAQKVSLLGALAVCVCKVQSECSDNGGMTDACVFTAESAEKPRLSRCPSPGEDLKDPVRSMVQSNCNQCPRGPVEHAVFRWHGELFPFLFFW